MDSKLLGALSLCRKAGKLRMGMDSACGEVAAGGPALVLMTDDLAQRSREKVERICADYGVPARILPFGMDALLQISKKRCGIFAVCDSGFAKLILQRLAAGD